MALPEKIGAPELVLKRAQWLRAAILGAVDGLISTASLMLGVGAVKQDRWSMILSGLAGAVAGACSMAVGEFISVSTQRDIEKKSITDQAKNQQEYPAIELVITSSSTPITTHTRGGRSPTNKILAEDANKSNALMSMKQEAAAVVANPYKAAGASALSFLCGSFVPLASAMFLPNNVTRMAVTAVVTSIALAVFGAVGAYLGGLSMKMSAAKVVVGGWMAMVITYTLLKPFNDDHKQ